MPAIWRVPRWVDDAHPLEALVEAVVGPEACGGVHTEATCAVTVDSQDLGHGSVLVWEATAPVEYACGAAEAAGEHGGEAAQGKVGTRIYTAELQAVGREGIDGWGELYGAPKCTDVVTSERADTDEDHIAARA